MSTFLRTLALTAAAVGAIACVPQDGGYYADSGYYGNNGYRDGGYSRYRDRDQSNSCRWAYNGVCDEGRYGGTNRCNDGTDRADCLGYGKARGANSCRWAYNGICDEGRYGGTNRCNDGTDTADCSGDGGQGGYSRRSSNGWPFD